MAETLTKTERVRELFSQTDWWVQNWKCPIQIRAQAVREFVGDQTFDSILDIGCGDGSLTAPLLTESNHLTLLDLADSMLAIARSRVPAHLRARVTCINADAVQADLPRHSFDLIVCVGVFAHVENPARLVQRIAELLKPGGLVITECTDSAHILTKLHNFRGALVSVLKPPSYRLNRIAAAQLLREFSAYNLVARQSYRYTFSIAGISRLFSNERNFRLIRSVYGPATANRNAWLGNQCLLTLRNSD